MTIGINTSPLAGQSGKKLTARLVKNRLDAELVGNVSIRVLPTERPDTWEVQGRGELQLAILVEIMRREGFELTVGKPQVVTREIDGKLHEPMERLTIDAPSDYQGVLIQLLALRKGRLEQMVDHGTGWIRMEYIVPARGLIGFRTEFLTETRGTGLLHHVHERYEPWHGELRTRPTGSLVADRPGATTGFALANLQERGTMFVGPGTEVYEGMIVGENSRSDDMDVNPTKEKKLTNMRQSSGDILVPLIPHQAALARAGPGVLPRGRVRRGHARRRPDAQGHPRRRPTGPGPPPGASATERPVRRRAVARSALRWPVAASCDLSRIRSRGVTTCLGAVTIVQQRSCACRSSRWTCPRVRASGRPRRYAPVELRRRGRTSPGASTRRSRRGSASFDVARIRPRRRDPPVAQRRAAEIAGRSLSQIAWGRLRRDKVAMVSHDRRPVIILIARLRAADHASCVGVDPDTLQRPRASSATPAACRSGTWGGISLDAPARRRAAAPAATSSPGCSTARASRC